ELQVKVLDGCRQNGHFWVFLAGTTNREFTLNIEDLETGSQWQHHNPQRQLLAPVADTRALATCP
ncbi:MAG: hypothetical protein KDD47_22535, partial [Acidobacteria bacterium]|nr:hypothetical protein [Acidobacteriota bacterium]